MSQSNKESMIRDLTREEIESVAGAGEVTMQYMTQTDPDDTKGGGDAGVYKNML